MTIKRFHVPEKAWIQSITASTFNHWITWKPFSHKRKPQWAWRNLQQHNGSTKNNRNHKVWSPCTQKKKSWIEWYNNQPPDACKNICFYFYPKFSFYVAYLLLNSYSQLGPQTSIDVIVANKGKEMCWCSEYKSDTQYFSCLSLEATYLLGPWFDLGIYKILWS